MERPASEIADNRLADGPARQSVSLLLSANDIRRLDEEREGTGLSRSQWLTALARRRLGEVRQFDQHDRYRLRRILETLERISANLAQLSSVAHRAEGPATQERVADETERFRREVLGLADDIKAAFLESDRYWKLDAAP